MAYTRVNWQDLPSTTTPRNATNLNKMDSAIKEHDDKLLGNTSMGNVVVDSIRSKNMYDKSTIIAGDIINNDKTIRLSSRQVLYLTAGTYTLSTNATSPFRYTIQVQNVGIPPLSDYPTYIYNSGWKSGSVSDTFTLSTSGYFTLVLSKENNATLTPSDVAGFNYQLEKGSTATTYSPYQQLDTYDTGWVDLSSYVNTTYFTIRPGFNPMARRIGNMVFLKGSVYCSTAVGSFNTSILTNIPAQFRTPEEISGAGVHYNLGRPYKIFVENGNINVSEGANIPTTQYYQGYALSDLGPYLAS